MASAQPEHPSENQAPVLPEGEEPKYGGFTRFEIELEFVQCLANPWYLNHLASQKFLSQPSFIAYLSYLRYWSKPPYLRYLTYPGPTLRNLEMLQQERFRQDIISPEVAGRLFEEGMRAAVEWHQGKDVGSVMAQPSANVVVGDGNAGAGIGSA